MDRKASGRKEEEIIDSDAQAMLNKICKGIDDNCGNLLAEIEQSLGDNEKKNLMIIRRILNMEKSSARLLVTDTFLLNGIHEKVLYLEKVVQRIAKTMKISESELTGIREKLDEETEKMKDLRPYLDALRQDFKRRKKWLRENV